MFGLWWIYYTPAGATWFYYVSKAVNCCYIYNIINYEKQVTLVYIASQNKASSSNIGIPDYSKVNSLIFAIKKYSGNIYEDSNLYPNPIFLADKSNSSFIIPEDGWILYIRPEHIERGKDSEYETYLYYYYVNNNRIYDAPTPVKKGDSITSLDTEDNSWGGYVIYAPNQKSK